jgi:hypothetical protein
MSDTPRTDAETGDCRCGATLETDVVPRSRAVELERELNAAKAENDSKLALIKRLHRAITARMSADEPTGEERLELSLAWKEAQETIDKAKL